MKTLTVAAVQFDMLVDQKNNIDKATAYVCDAVEQKGAQVVLLPELFSTPYFCKTQNADYFELAHTAQDSLMLSHFSQLAKQLKVVLPISFFERDGQRFYNSVMMIDADGERLGLYRKTHIPDGPGYQEKFYFSPGNTGYKAWRTRYGLLGCGICWDQWFPEAARAMVLQGAEILLYPTAIGSEPQDPTLESCGHWQRVMQGHAAANMVPVVAANRIGVEKDQDIEVTFYGSSFVTDNTGKILACANKMQNTILDVTFDLDELKKARASWGLFRDL